MTIYDIIRERGFRSSFGLDYLNPDSYDGVETVVFTTEEKADRLRAYSMGESTFIVVSQTYKESREKLEAVKSAINVLFPMSKVSISTKDLRIRIERFRS